PKRCWPGAGGRTGETTLQAYDASVATAASTIKVSCGALTSTKPHDARSWPWSSGCVGGRTTEGPWDAAGWKGSETANPVDRAWILVSALPYDPVRVYRNDSKGTSIRESQISVMSVLWCFNSLQRNSHRFDSLLHA